MIHFEVAVDIDKFLSCLLWFAYGKGTICKGRGI